jgi:hypothetical protein
MEDRAKRGSNTAVEAARQRLARLKFASVTASVLAFGGLTAAIAFEVSSTPVSAASVPAASGVVQAKPTHPVIGDDSYDDGAPARTTGAPPQAAAPAPPIVSAQS